VKIKEIIFLGLILVVSLLVRLWRLDIPQEMYFDEIYHVPAVQMLAAGDFQTPFEWWHQADWPIYYDWLHPPLAKYIQALSLNFFDFLPAPVAWRLPSVIFSLMSLLVFYFFAKDVALSLLTRQKIDQRLFNKQKVEDLAINFALISSLLLASDGLFLVQSRIAMNDIFYLFFALAASYCYFQYYRHQNLIVLFLTGVMLAFALSTKWSAIWLIGFFFILELYQLVKEKKLQQLPFTIFSLLLTPVFVYFLIFTPYFLSGKTLTDFYQLQKQIIIFQQNWASPHPYQSSPLAWMINWRPVWYFADLTENNWRKDIFAQGNPVLFLYFLFLPIFLWRWQRSLKTKRAITKWRNLLVQKTYLLLICLFFASFLPWIVVTRPMFFYHFLPALPYLILIVTWPIYLFILSRQSQQQRQLLLFHFLFWPVLIAIIFYPHWTALPVPEAASNYLYFVLPSWR
jgi:dolichyl-phosphate-mannose--protein O-mannosyl transferase